MIGATVSMVFYVAYFIFFYEVEEVFSVFDMPKCTSNIINPFTILNVIIEAMHRFGMIDIMLLPITVIMIKSN